MPTPSSVPPVKVATLDEFATSIPGFGELVSARRRLGYATIMTVMAIYVGFFALVAFAPAWLETPVPGWGSLAFLFMFLMFIAAWAITWLYLTHTARKLAPLDATVRTALLAHLDAANTSELSR